MGTSGESNSNKNRAGTTQLKKKGKPVKQKSQNNTKLRKTTRKSDKPREKKVLLMNIVKSGKIYKLRIIKPTTAKGDSAQRRNHKIPVGKDKPEGAYD